MGLFDEIKKGASKLGEHASNGSKRLQSHARAGGQRLSEHSKKIQKGESPITTENIKNETGRAVENIKKTFTKAQDDFAREIILNALLGYYNDLRSSASGHWKSLPDALISALEASGAYDTIDLSKVRYAENADTRPREKGNAITLAYEIFFPYDIDLLNSRDDVHWMLHELEHTIQYETAGGLTAFLVAYVADIVLSALGGVLNVIANPTRAAERIQDMNIDTIHDQMHLERAAEDKADDLIDQIADALGIEEAGTTCTS